ncbi:MAG TPA: inositol monophosphatase family protein, partial [Planctomycetota bacterium]|nr:inositol monophosphatase family protein [Planctomycetota bacterium]
MKELLQFAFKLSTEAEKKILPHFNSRVAIDDKADGTPVTIADKGAEETMRGLIAKHYPDHGIMGEEFGITNGKGQYRWILDPIDGTKSFIFGVPLFGTLIALEHTPSPTAAPRIELGLVHFPMLGRTIYATLGHGAFERDDKTLDVEQLRVSTTPTVEKALVLTSSLHNVTDATHGAAVHRIVTRARYGRSWGDCFGYYMVASGKADAMMDTV